MEDVVVLVTGETLVAVTAGRSEISFFLASGLTSPNRTLTSSLVENPRAGEINLHAAFAEPDFLKGDGN
jgi:hypothetical protein